MNKLFLPYNKTILKLNIVFSLFLTILSSLFYLSKEPSHSPIFIVISGYAFWIMTGGFLLSAYYYEMNRKKEYYFYYNLGITKIKLLLFTYFLHIIFISPFLYILQYV